MNERKEGREKTNTIKICKLQFHTTTKTQSSVKQAARDTTDPGANCIFCICFLFSFCLFSVGGFASDICISESPIVYAPHTCQCNSRKFYQNLLVICLRCRHTHIHHVLFDLRHWEQRTGGNRN